jgi:tetratricopeptide (TPR) repeat protein
MAIGGKGHALQALGRLDQAIACFERVVALAPGSASARQDLANARQARG